MGKNINVCATELQKALHQSEAYIRLETIYNEINNDEATKNIFNNFRALQMKLEQKQMAGQSPTNEEVIEVQSGAKIVQENEKISKLMDAEQQMGKIIDEINKIFMKPLGDLYEDLN